ncbi:MAG: hypothetical protein ABL862_07645, partial [Candidatus Nitrotoga sp.]
TQATGQRKGRFANPSTGQIGRAFKYNHKLSVPTIILAASIDAVMPDYFISFKSKQIWQAPVSQYFKGCAGLIPARSS